jgi:uncharacterized protein DUF4394
MSILGRFACAALGLALCTAAADGAPIVAVTTTNLLRFDSTAPGSVATTAISGLTPGDTIVGIDRRPASLQVYALTRTAVGVGRLYVLDTTTAAAQLVVTLAPDPADATAPYLSLSGTRFGVDFNPVADRLRVVSDTGMNLRINPGNGLVITDAALNPGAPTAVGAAYANNFFGASQTTLYVIDSGTDALMIQNPPNNGTLTTVGAGLGIDVSDTAAFDIADLPAANSAFATLQVAGVTGLYRIDLAAGVATSVGNVLGNPAIIGMTLSAGSRFFSVTPCRVLDTRNPDGPYGGPALVAGADRTFAIAGQCGVPPGAAAVSVNLAVTQPTTVGNLRLFPAGTALPVVSSINYSAGQTRSNNAIVRLNALGEMAVRCAQASGTAGFILDVNGYFE